MEKKTRNLFCLLIGVIVFAFFAHTLNYSWKHFDENIIFQETMLPIPASFSEIFEFINLYGINNHFIASNPFYSNIYHIRGTPIDVVFIFFVFWLFQKSAFAYHSFSLTLHILNSCLCFLILNNISLSFKSNLFIRLLFVSFLTLLWALHPVNVESVLFAINFGALITYFFCFLLFILLVNNSASKTSLLHSVIAFLLYLFPLFLNEYSVTLPFILFCYLFATYSFYGKMSLKDSFLVAIKKILPLVFALVIFVVYFFLLPAIRTTQESSLLVTLERIFWLSPQIFLHYLKLIIFPIHLSIDQTALVKFPYSLFHPYAIFSSLFMYSLILLSFISFFLLNKRVFFYFSFILFVPFFLALLPFLHIISPIYCIASERYLYFPLALFTFGVAFLIFYLLSKLPPRDVACNVSTCVPMLVILFILLLTTSTRTYLRTLDWKNSVTLFSSALNEAPNDLFKALRMQFLGSILSEYYSDNESQLKGKEYINASINTINKSLVTLEYKKQRYQDKLPQIIKVYGLDPKTIQAKTGYLLAFTKIGLFKDADAAYEILKPYMQDLSILDTPILDLYLGLSFARNNLDEAEKILNHALENKICPTILIILSQLQQLKYNDLSGAEKYLKQSFKYFPYDVQTLLFLKTFYFYTKNIEEFAFFSYLHGIRTHSEQSLQDALKVFTHLNDKAMVNKSMKSIKLIREDKI